MTTNKLTGVPSEDRAAIALALSGGQKIFIRLS